MVLQKLFLSPFSFMYREKKGEQGTRILRGSHLVIGLRHYLVYFCLFLIVIFPSHGICYQTSAQVSSSSPFYQFSSGQVTKNISVTGKIFPFLEIAVDYQAIEWEVPGAKNYKAKFSAFSLQANEPVVITFSGVEDLKPAFELNKEKGIDVPEEAVTSRIKVKYSFLPLSTKYLSPEKLNDKPIVVPFSEDEKKFNLFQKLEVARWNTRKREGTYPHVWHEDPEGFIVTVTVNP